MGTNVVIIYPPTADPTSPYISLPVLSGYLRSKGIAAFPIDANIEFYCRLLEKKKLDTLCRRVERRTQDLAVSGNLSHAQALELSASPVYDKGFSTLPDRVAGALRVLRGSAFYDDAAYSGAVETVELALSVLSAAYYPARITFSSYRTPFALLCAKEIQDESQPDRNPFLEYIAGDLVPRLREVHADVVGFSVAFTGQLQSAFSFAYTLRRMMPDMYLTAGGPALTQLLAHRGAAGEGFLGPFDSIVLFEGETALLQIAEALASGLRPAGIITGSNNGDLGRLPFPDYEGLPLDLYLSPEPVLPVDFTRGCYWGRCAFCHYGLTSSGTAPYRERPHRETAAALHASALRYGSRIFYLSGDTVSPAALEHLFLSAKTAGLPNGSIRWASDIRAESSLTADRISFLKESGALAFSFGVESGSDTILRRMNKGLDRQTMQAVIRRVSEAGIAAEIMCFYGFPGETFAEAMETVELVNELDGLMSLFMFGEFSLSRGSAVAAHPESFDIEEVWTVKGDEIGSALFFTPLHEWKSEKELMSLDEAIRVLADQWAMRSYPWAGSLSTAHTLLRYDRNGPSAFKNAGNNRTPVKTAHETEKPYKEINRIKCIAGDREAAVWHTMIYELKTVSRELHEKLTSGIPPVRLRHRALFQARPG
ncbi:MAG: radical SAM protein [Spirochaetales bacterium]|nr:radical SAM protein [Spirochaetales bacterium]